MGYIEKKVYSQTTYDQIFKVGYQKGESEDNRAEALTAMLIITECT
jgi:hypothetical protein